MMNFLSRLLRIGDYSSERLLGGTRSGLWPRVRKQHLELNPKCAVCGKSRTLLEANEVHHITPFSMDKHLELSNENLITLCPRDHLLFGHLGSFHSFNSEVAGDARIMKDKIKARP